MGRSFDRYVVLASRGIENWDELDEVTQYILYVAHRKREEGNDYAPSELPKSVTHNLWVPKLPGKFVPLRRS